MPTSIAPRRRAWPASAEGFAIVAVFHYPDLRLRLDRDVGWDWRRASIGVADRRRR
jgi:hypothetical protein